MTRMVKIGSAEVVVEIEASRHPLPFLSLAAKCGEAIARMRVSLHPKHDQTTEQFKKEIDRAVQQIAEEAAGHARSHELLASIDTEVGE